MTSTDTFEWLNTSAEAAARRLLGSQLISTIDGETVKVRIVETEAYDQTDAASHSFGGRTKRNDAMFLSAGHLYVYLSYGIHYCCNVVCGPKGLGSGVLIRAVEPLEGTDTIHRRRRVTGVNATNGPGKVGQALGIDLSLSGHDLTLPPVQLAQRPPLPNRQTAVTARIGISRETHALRRYVDTTSPFVSSPRGGPKAAS